MAQSAPVSHWAGCDRHARRSSAGGSRSANDKPLPGHKRYPLHAVFSQNTMTTAAPESPPKTLYMPIGDSAESPEKPRHVPRNRRRGSLTGTLLAGLTLGSGLVMSAFGSKAVIRPGAPQCLLMTRTGHRCAPVLPPVAASKVDPQ